MVVCELYENCSYILASLIGWRPGHLPGAYTVYTMLHMQAATTFYPKSLSVLYLSFK
jgi:hypothetical protein